MRFANSTRAGERKARYIKDFEINKLDIRVKEIDENRYIILKRNIGHGVLGFWGFGSLYGMF